MHVNGSEYGEYCIESEAVRRGAGRPHMVNRVRGLPTLNLVDAVQSATVHSAIRKAS